VTDQPRRWCTEWRGLLLALVGAALSTGCNSVFGIHEGAPRPMCTDSLMIDDMEDGDGSICRTGGRRGVWFDFGDGSPTGDLTPRSDLPFTPTRIEDGSRGSSRYAARFAGSGFTAFGAFMGFVLMNPPGSYDAAGGLGGITFWMKSNVPVFVDFPTSDTTLVGDGGDCDKIVTPDRCNNHFTFKITAPVLGWSAYQIPFNALSGGGSAIWNPRHLFGVNFRVPPGAAFEVWIDDVAFYQCAGPECQPTCNPQYQVSCRIGNGARSSCEPLGTDCSAVAGWCVDSLLIDDMEDGDATICHSGKRDGSWYVADDGTSTNLTPAAGSIFVQTAILGGRGTSHQAARLTGSGFTAWGAQMGFSLNSYDASQASGIKFWMKSDAPVEVGFDTPTTTTAGESTEGVCQDSPTEQNCDFDFAFEVGSSGDGWVERAVPFAALRQTEPYHGHGNLHAQSATWDPSRLLGIHFGTLLSTFDMWIDDVRFYSCQTESCLPCPAETVACPASGGRPTDCWPKGTDCSTPPDRVNYGAVWGNSPTDVWTVGYEATTLAGTLLHWNGAAWSADTSTARPPMFDVWGSGPTDLWAMGDQGTILHGNGSTWLATASGTTSTFNGIWGSGPRDVWAIEFPGTMRHWNGTAWSTAPRAAGKLVAVWGSGPHDVWAVGDNGTILRGDGSTWSTTTTGEGHQLNGVWGTSAHDVWAVGGAGTIVHWDGSAWLAFPGDTVLSLRGVWGAGPSDVWAVGDNGTIVHWDGLVWLAFPSGTKERLYAVWGSGPKDVWAVGHGSTILHWDGVGWSPSSP